MRCENDLLPTKAIWGSVGLRTRCLTVAHWTLNDVTSAHSSSLSRKSLPLSPPSSFLFSPTPQAFFQFPCSCLSQDLCTRSSSARNPSPTHYMLPPSHCHLSFNDIFSERRCAIHWPVALNFLHPSIFIISFLGHFKCVIGDHPPRPWAWCRDGACVHLCPRNTQ